MPPTNDHDLDRRLSGDEISARLAALPGWHVLADSSAIYAGFWFPHTVHAVLFADFFGAAARIAPFDLAFVVELSGYWAGVGIGAEKADGITPGAFVIAEVADAVARANCAIETGERDCKT
jgi:hypothetical protein